MTLGYRVEADDAAVVDPCRNHEPFSETLWARPPRCRATSSPSCTRGTGAMRDSWPAPAW